MRAKLYDRVRLKDGREGIVVDIYDGEKYEKPGYEIELSDDDPQGPTFGFPADTVECVISRKG